MANELTTIETGRWLALRDAAGGMALPFQQDIFLLECHVAGTLRVDDLLVKTEKVCVGDGVKLLREPANPHDELAIAVHTAGDERIGWVPRKHNPVLARLMDAGKCLIAKLVSKQLEGHWLNLRIAISLKEV